MEIRITRHPWRGDAGRRARLVCGLAIVAWLLDAWWPLHAAPANVAFWGIFIAIASGIAHFIHAAGDAIITVLWTVVQWLRTGIVFLGKAIKTGVFELGRATARVLRAVKTFAVDVLPRFIKWSYGKLLKFSEFLKLKFKPVLEWLKVIKDHVDWFYKKFIRPVLDTIEFVRAINRTLQVFHVDVLRELDRVLTQIEQRIEEPFSWVRGKITWIENTIDRIVTLDGLIQKLTLIASLNKYAPTWIRTWWSRALTTKVDAGDDYARTRDYPLDEPWANGKELASFYKGEDNRMAGYVGELVPLWFEALKIDSPPPVYD